MLRVNYATVQNSAIRVNHERQRQIWKWLTVPAVSCIGT